MYKNEQQSKGRVTALIAVLGENIFRFAAINP